MGTISGGDKRHLIRGNGALEVSATSTDALLNELLVENKRMRLALQIQTDSDLSITEAEER